MYSNVVLDMLCLYNAVSLTLLREQRFIRIIIVVIVVFVIVAVAVTGVLREFRASRAAAALGKCSGAVELSYDWGKLRLYCQVVKERNIVADTAFWVHTPV